MGHQSQVPNLGFYHLISSPCCSLSTYCLCCSYYRFSVLKHFQHCLLHTHFTTQPPSCFIQLYHSTVTVTVCSLDALLAHSNTHISQHFIEHHHSLLSLLQCAIWKHSWHCVTHTLFKASSAHVVPLFSCHLSDYCHASHSSSVLVRALRWVSCGHIPPLFFDL